MLENDIIKYVLMCMMGKKRVLALARKQKSLLSPFLKYKLSDTIRTLIFSIGLVFLKTCQNNKYL